MTHLPIHGHTIVIDRLVPTDARALSRSHSDAGNARYQDWTHPLSEIAAHRFIVGQTGAEPFVPGEPVQLAIRDTMRGRLVGDLYLNRPANEPWMVEVGITLAPGAGGRGRARRAITAAVDAALAVDDEHGPIHRVVGRVHADNERSLRLFGDLGFRREAHHARNLRQRDGTFADEIVFAVTADCWRRPSSGPPVIEADPHPADVAFLDDRIYEFNVARTGFDDGTSLASFRRDELGRIQAGIFGWTWGRAAYVQTFWVRDDVRHRSIGTGLLAAFESEALRRGCRRVFLATHTFQAPAFYERHGYRRTGHWDDYPSGHGDVFLEKTLE